MCGPGSPRCSPRPMGRWSEPAWGRGPPHGGCQSVSEHFQEQCCIPGAAPSGFLRRARDRERSPGARRPPPAPLPPSSFNQLVVMHVSTSEGSVLRMRTGDATFCEQRPVDGIVAKESETLVMFVPPHGQIPAEDETAHRSSDGRARGYRHPHGRGQRQNAVPRDLPDNWDVRQRLRSPAVALRQPTQPCADSLQLHVGPHGHGRQRQGQASRCANPRATAGAPPRPC